MASMLFKRTLGRLTAPNRRNIVTSPLRRSEADPLIGHVEQEAYPGSNLPFSIENRYKLAAVMILFFGSGFSAPFLVVRHQLLKKNSS